MPDGLDLVLDLVVDRVDLVDEGANSEAHIQLFKRKEKETNMDFEQILKSMDPAQAEVIKAEVAKAKAEVPAETAAELEKVKQDVAKAEEKYQSAFDEAEAMKSKVKELQKPDELSFEEVLKSMPADVQTVMKRLNDQKVAAEKMASELAEKALQEEAVAKADSLKALPVEKEALVKILKEATPEVVEVLKAANKAIEETVPFTEVGKDKKDTAVSTADAEHAWEQIEKKAEAISAEQKVTKQKAISIAVEQNPDLYRKYLAGGAN